MSTLLQIFLMSSRKIVIVQFFLLTADDQLHISIIIQKNMVSCRMPCILHDLVRKIFS